MIVDNPKEKGKENLNKRQASLREKGRHKTRQNQIDNHKRHL